MSSVFSRTKDGQTIEIHHDYITRKLLEKYKAQVDLEIIAKILESNDLGVTWRMFHWC